MNELTAAPAIFIHLARNLDEMTRGAEVAGRLVRRFLHAYTQLMSQPASVSTILKRAREDAEDELESPSRYVAEPYLDALRRMAVIDEVPA